MSEISQLENSLVLKLTITSQVDKLDPWYPCTGGGAEREGISTSSSVQSGHVVSVHVSPRQISRTVLAVTPYLGAIDLHWIMLPRRILPVDILGRSSKISST